MTAAILIPIIAQYGLPLAQQLWQWSQTPNRVITQADWDLLDQLSKYRSSDALAAAGIRIENGVVVPIPPAP